MHISFALFADAANLSQEGKLNILGVFDAVQVGQLPAMHPRAHLVVRLKGTRSDIGGHRVTLRWLNPKGNELWSSTGDISVAAPPNGVNDLDLPMIAQLDLPLDTAGAYKMTVALDDQPAADVKLQVRSAPPVAPMNQMMS
jgi:hypothetical protein